MSKTFYKDNGKYEYQFSESYPFSDERFEKVTKHYYDDGYHVYTAWDDTRKVIFVFIGEMGMKNSEEEVETICGYDVSEKIVYTDRKEILDF